MRRSLPRDPFKEQYWRDTFERQAASGLGPKAFCEREGINENSYYSWRALIKKRDAEKPTKSAAKDVPTPQPSSSEFVPIQLISTAAPASETAGGHIEICTPSGFVVKVFNDVNVGTLRVVLAVLRGATC